MRCFVALDLPRPVRNHLQKVTAPLHARFALKAVPPENMHVTLLFAGEQPPDHVDALAAEVDELPLPDAGITLSLDAFGVFPPKGVPRVAWAGLEGDVAAVTTLQQRLVRFGETLDIPREKRPFAPHVTIARLKDRFGALALVDRLTELDDELNKKPFAAEALTLYGSTLTPAGPRYEVVHRRELARPA